MGKVVVFCTRLLDLLVLTISRYGQQPLLFAQILAEMENAYEEEDHFVRDARMHHVRDSHWANGARSRRPSL
jgi:hypothetical protein